MISNIILTCSHKKFYPRTCPGAGQSWKYNDLSIDQSKMGTCGTNGKTSIYYGQGKMLIWGTNGKIKINPAVKARCGHEVQILKTK